MIKAVNKKPPNNKCKSIRIACLRISTNTFRFQLYLTQMAQLNQSLYCTLFGGHIEKARFKHTLCFSRCFKANAQLTVSDRYDQVVYDYWPDFEIVITKNIRVQQLISVLVQYM